MSGSLRAVKDRELTQESFDCLLSRLDPEREAAGLKYETLRHKLVKYFEWRGSLFPEEFADETINRVARKIHHGAEVVNDAVLYAFGVARLVNLERLKEQRKEEAVMKEQALTAEARGEASEDARLECFQKCLQKLDVDSRELVVSYYGAEERGKIDHRKELAERLKVSINTLRIRTHRIRAKLERCVLECLNGATLT